MTVYPSAQTDDLSATRRYLHDIAAMCEEAATSLDPRVPALALEVLIRAGAELANEATQ